MTTTFELPLATVTNGYMHDEHHWCYYDTEYPEEGSCGPYESEEEAVAAAEEAGYLVETDLLRGHLPRFPAMDAKS